MQFLDVLVALLSVLMAGSGTVMVGVAIRAYWRAPTPTMLHFAIGFTLIVASTLSTTISFLFRIYASTEWLLIVGNAIALLGFLLLVYGLISHNPSEQRMKVA